MKASALGSWLLGKTFDHLLEDLRPEAKSLKPSLYAELQCIPPVNDLRSEARATSTR